MLKIKNDEYDIPPRYSHLINFHLNKLKKLRDKRESTGKINDWIYESLICDELELDVSYTSFVDVKIREFYLYQLDYIKYKYNDYKYSLKCDKLKNKMNKRSEYRTFLYTPNNLKRNNYGHHYTAREISRSKKYSNKFIETDLMVDDV